MLVIISLWLLLPPLKESNPFVVSELAIIQGNSIKATLYSFVPKISSQAILSDKYSVVMDIVASADKYEIKNTEKQIKVGICESGLDQTKIGSAGEIGTYQFKIKTWNWFNSLRNTNLNIYNQQDQIDMFNWAIKNNYSSHWTCWKLTN